MRGKIGALEMSIGTIVVVVLSMSMLILGMILIQNIFSGANENILSMNDNVKDEISKLFTEDSKTVVYLSNHMVEIKQNEDWGIAFGITNLQKGTTDVSRFSYNIVVSDPDATRKCGIGETDIENWITTGKSDTIAIAPGQNYYGIARFMVPEGAPICIVRFHIDVTKDGLPYASDFFDIETTI